MSVNKYRNSDGVAGAPRLDCCTPSYTLVKVAPHRLYQLRQNARTMTASKLAGQVSRVKGDPGITKFLCKDQVGIYLRLHDHTHNFKKLTFCRRLA